MSEVQDQDDIPSFTMEVKDRLTTHVDLDLDATVTSPTVVESSWIDADG